MFIAERDLSLRSYEFYNEGAGDTDALPVAYGCGVTGGYRSSLLPVKGTDKLVPVTMYRLLLSETFLKWLAQSSILDRYKEKKKSGMEPGSTVQQL